MPLPGSDLGDLESHPEPFLVLADALMGAGQRRRALMNPPFELVIRQLQGLLRPFPLGDLTLESLVETRQLPGLAEEIDKDTDLGPQDRGIDRFAEVVDCARAVAPQDVILIDQ